MADAMDVTPVANDALTDTTTKRKRDDHDSDAVMTNGTSTQSQTQLDILEILKRQDTQPSLLDHEFSASASGPVQKKAKQSDPSSKTTIAQNLRTGAYASLVQLQQDAAHVSKELVTTIRTAEKQDGQNARPSVDDLKRIQKIGALEKYIKDVAESQIKYEAARAHNAEGATQHNVTLTNGHAQTASAQTLKSGTVLTLFGNAPTPKQLFSSMQHSPGTKQDGTLRTELPVEEMSLPNGLSATKIMQSGATETKSTPTFEDTFAPPYSLPHLQPPKNQKRSSLRDNSVTWEFKDNVPRGTKRGGYTTMSLNTGDWLGWGGIDPVAGAEAPKEKRKQRDRALSSTEAKPTPPTQATLEAEAIQYEEALFRKCFSSFAPSTDNTKSLIPTQTKDMIWFSKLGEQRFDETFGKDPALTDKPAPVIDPALLEMDAQEAEFGKMVEELESMPEESLDEPVVDNTDPDVVLRKTSELLETLASLQRIRNSALPGNNSISRTPISPAPVLASRVGKPDAPAEEEINTYNKLRREIAYLVLQLPPYMVAKLNGDQLADLGVGTRLPFETLDYKGSMEEDQVTRASKYSAAATASSIAHLTRQTSSTSGQHYSSANSRTPAIGAAANTRYGQTAPTSRTPATAPVSYQRSTSQTGNYGTPSAAPRSSYGQQSQYTRPGAPQQPSYGQANGQPSYYGQQRPPSAASGHSGYGSYGQTAPQTQPRPTYSSSQPLQQFQQRSQAAAQNAVAYQTNIGPGTTSQAFNRTASPAKSSLYGLPATSGTPGPQQTGQQQQTQQQQQQQPRSQAYSNMNSQQYGQQPGSGRATPTFASQPQTPVNGGLSRQPPTLISRAASGTPQPIAPQPAANQNGNAYFDTVSFVEDAQTGYGQDGDGLATLPTEADKQPPAIDPALLALGTNSTSAVPFVATAAYGQRMLAPNNAPTSTVAFDYDFMVPTTPASYAPFYQAAPTGSATVYGPSPLSQQVIVPRGPISRPVPKLAAISPATFILPSQPDAVPGTISQTPGQDPKGIFHCLICPDRCPSENSIRTHVSKHPKEVLREWMGRETWWFEAL